MVRDVTTRIIKTTTLRSLDSERFVAANKEYGFALFARLAFNHQPFRRYVPIQDLCALFFSKRAFDILFASFSAKECYATTASGATHLCGFCSVRQSLFDQTIHLRSGDAGRKAFAIWISRA